MAKSEENLDKYQEKELLDMHKFVEEAVRQSNLIGILGQASLMLLRLVHAQEKLTILAEVDLQETVEAEIQARAETLAEEIVQDKSKRGFIGQKK